VNFNEGDTGKRLHISDKIEKGVLNELESCTLSHISL